MNRIRARSCFFTGVVFFVWMVDARAQTPEWVLGVGYSVGSFIANDPREQYVQDGRTVLGEISVAVQTSGRKGWQRASGYPEMGVAIQSGRSGGSEYIGNMVSFIPFTNFHLYRTKGFGLNFRLGAGLSWVQKTFNAQTDYKNLVISTHLNACINGTLASRIRIGPRWGLDLGAAFTHISNGGIKVPNLGLNVPSLVVGVRYSLHAGGATLRFAKPPTPTDKKIHYTLYSFVAGKEAYPIASAVYLVNVVSFEALRDFSPTGRYGIGVNWTYDRANTDEVLTRTEYIFSSDKPAWQASVYGVYEYVMGRLSFPLQMGLYLYNNYKVNTFWQNIGIKYRLDAHWSAGVGLKAHLGNGDFIQGGFGYKF